ncbi:DNA mismatch repair protein MutL [Cutaneotrichosporon oleaginosum]|uniref:DNA mismatch repair protein MutL n=1 Tax=Cutaneotrichosporon oleaginosum TaxID=879819 RepID=A0A0J0XPC7_9TREE|nr:DNA mismatch repair protein MutL [Cutaneotrichosporon oleaginosum]KLT42955.1 DNA mismatch repair protein MutL [Cutaneotrichosporon oleaginosum]TXT12654.1 hypothetical protein COLE_03064 [Cutaneotrichosporon oleaginosum]
MSVGAIKAIDRESVHRIHSGQVVLDLQGVVKELVENAFDSGATSVDVRIKDHGLDSVEVVDNGSGIEQADWASIGLKHHTSKLPSLEGLSQVQTFGFRGEALAALCALCESVTVVTATKDTAPMGAVIKLGRNGAVVDDSGRVARQRGTTITLNGLFKTLPVRRKEFERTAKREYMKALGILNAYALVPASKGHGRTGVRLKVESIGAGKGGKRNIVLATDGRGSLKSSVSAVWGPKALEGVVEIDLELDVEIDRAMARREGIEETSEAVRVTGLISSATWGQGRSSADRQFTYINGRPCSLPTVMRAVNDVYKSFNTNQLPLAILDFQIPTESVDINVSPDKRTIMVHSEANLIEALRKGLDELFQPTRSSFAVGGASHTIKITQKGTEVNNEEAVEEAQGELSAESQHSEQSCAGDLAELDSEEEELGELDDSPGATSRPPTRASSGRGGMSRPSPPGYRLKQQTLDTTTAAWSPNRRDGPSSAFLRTPVTGRAARSTLRDRLAVFASQGSRRGVRDDDSDEEVVEILPTRTLGRPESSAELLEEQGVTSEEELGQEISDAEETPPAVAYPHRDAAGAFSTPRPVLTTLSYHDLVTEADPKQLDKARVSTRLQEAVAIEGQEWTDADNEALDGATSDVSLTSRSPSPTTEQTDQQREAVRMDVDGDDEPALDGYRNEIKTIAPAGHATLRFNLEKLRERSTARRRRRADCANINRSAFTTLREGAATEAAGLGNRDAEAAEDALSRVISKEDFARMEVLGQFNKGFIIARLRGHDTVGAISGSDDLFIIDQHASDEKYNFETLQRTTIIKAQALIKPRAMQLTAADELVAMENLDVLKANGFEVTVDEDAPPGCGQRVSLRAMPVSKETTFDFRDLEQLLHMLSDSSRPEGQTVRCTKARAMFAMRACRKSVMIGKALTKAQMVALLRNMGTIDQPWVCHSTGHR